MGCDGVSDVSAGAGEGVGRMMNGTGLLQGWEPVGVTILWGRRLVLTMNWQRGFWKVTEGGEGGLDLRRGYGNFP